VKEGLAFAGSQAIIALGSNLGDSPRHIREALRRLQSLSDQPLRCSSLWRSSPVDCPPGSPPFVNAVALLVPRPDETPESMLSKLQSLEKEFGRPSKRLFNEPRVLDLDLIAFGHETRTSPACTIPHPRACQRRFVLQLLSEIAPGLVLPGQKATVAALLAGLRTTEALTRLG
jgi:2-amino-4-hydroxy-6-hydroxymethyldihydropteridine diphosphokinase